MFVGMQTFEKFSEFSNWIWFSSVSFVGDCSHFGAYRSIITWSLAPQYNTIIDWLHAPARSDFLINLGALPFFCFGYHSNLIYNSASKGYEASDDRVMMVALMIRLKWKSLTIGVRLSDRCLRRHWISY